MFLKNYKVEKGSLFKPVYVGNVVSGNDEVLGDVAVRELDLHDEVGDILEKVNT